MKIISIIAGLLLSVSAFATQIQVQQVNTNVKTSSVAVDKQPQTQSYYRIDFGNLFVGQRTVSNFTLTNTGTTPLTFRDAYVSGFDFDANHSCTAGLQPGEKCYFSIAYWPRFEGMSSGRFVLSFNEEDLIFDLWGRATRQ